MENISYTVDPYTHPEADALRKAHADDAAVDLRAAQDCYLAPGDRALVPTGIRLKVPPGYAGLVLPRSGLALKEGLTVLNAPGLIDPGYRGEVGVILHLTASNDDIYRIAKGEEPLGFTIFKGERIAQLLLVNAETASFTYEPQELFDAVSTERGEGGFGSSGVE